MKGILFKEPLFNAIIEGRKTQTRRIIKPQPDARGMRTSNVLFEDWHGNKAKPRYNKGEVVYLKEPYIDDLRMDKVFYKFNKTDRKEIEREYTEIKNPWKNKLFMPADVARYFIKVTSVRAERIADISKEDAIAEGLTSLSKDKGRTYKYGIPDRDGYPGTCDVGMAWQDWNVDPREVFKTLWNSINNNWKEEKDGVKRKYPFDGPNMKGEKVGTNELTHESIPSPWVWVYEFKLFYIEDSGV